MSDPIIATQRETILGILTKGEWERHGELDRLCEEVLRQVPNDTLALYGSAFANMKRETAQKGIEAARRLNQIQPSADGSWIQGMNEVLAGGSGLSSFEKAAEGNPKYDRHVLLGRAIEAGTRIIEVADFKFPLATFNAQAIESTLYHLSGALTEEDELLAIEAAWEPGKHILEIGVLIGNHTAFFLRRLLPSRIDIYEMDEACIPYLEETIRLNNLGTVCQIHRQAVSGATPIPKADYFKIDIDGGEDETIPGLWPVLKTCRGGLLEVDKRNEGLSGLVGEPVRRFDHGGYENWLLALR
ncbi:MAG: hypothetical protein HQL43_04725 [Alphaproteobacteria bacterium]|nr:hypothetical protein [Alphaproteobacteria bacterium]